MLLKLLISKIRIVCINILCSLFMLLKLIGMSFGKLFGLMIGFPRIRPSINSILNNLSLPLAFRNYNPHINKNYNPRINKNYNPHTNKNCSPHTNKNVQIHFSHQFCLINSVKFSLVCFSSIRFFQQRIKELSLKSFWIDFKSLSLEKIHF